MRKNTNFRKLMILAIAAFMCLSAVTIVGNAAYIELGNPTSTSYESYVPFYGYYDYSWSAVIYLQSELGGAKAINGLTYDVYFQQVYTIYNQKIWMKHTTDINWVGNYLKPDPVADGYTLVYEGDITFTAARFSDFIPLDTDFSYNGVDNLIIYWENWDGDYASGQPRWYYPGSSYAPNRVKYRYSDGSMPGDATSASYYFPNIRIHFPTDHDVAVQDIIMPELVEGYGNIPVHVAVKNVGLNTETFPVNVVINAPPMDILDEGFEDTYSIRPNPPAGWLVKDNNLDGYFSGTYAYNMWGSYYSSSYAHTGTMSMRMDYGGSGGDDDWLFTPGASLTAGTTYTLEWWDRMSSSSTSYSNNLEVYYGMTQDDTGMTTQIYADPAMYHTTHTLHTVTFTVPTTGTYYIGFWRVNGYSYANMFIDDVHLFIPGSAIYDQTVTMTSLSPGSVSEANLPDWVVSSPGTYEVIATTLLGIDENTMDDQKIQYTTVGLFDAQLDSIDFPQTYMGPVSFNPIVTVSNVGAMDFANLPVHATVLDPAGGTGTVFTEDFEAAPSISVYDGENEVILDPNEVAKYDEFTRINGLINWEDDEADLSDTGDWTVLNPDNNGAMWHRTDYRSSPASPTHSMYHGDESTHYYLPSSMDILISPKIHIGNAGGSFSFDIYNDVEGGSYDNVFFGVSPDGMSWGWWFGGSWWMTWYNSGGVPIYSGDVDANGDGYVAFMFMSDSSVEYEGAYIDNVEVQGSPLFYDETVYLSLAAGGTAQVGFPAFTPDPAYGGYYDLTVCCEEPKDSIPANDCDVLSFTCNSPVWNDRTGLGFPTIQQGIDDPDTLPGDIIMVNDGNFFENIVIDKGITVSGLHEPDCLTGYSYLFGTVDIVADNVILQNLYVHPLEYFNHSQAAIAIYSNNVIVRHNTVEIQGGTNGTIKGIHAYATPSEFTQNIEISDNCVHDVINCGGTGGGGGGGLFFDFENDNGGWTPGGVPDWEWTNTYDSSLYVPSGGYETSQIPPTTAYSGTGLWGTVIYGPYSNSASYTTLSKTFDFTGMTGVQIDWYSWEDTFGSWDYCELYANGALVWGPSYDYSDVNWEHRIADLSAYDGMSSVELRFSMYATSVVAYAGWYIDDVGITSAKDRYGDGIKDTMLSEGFESGVPPSGWILNQQNVVETWHAGTYSHSGSYAAQCLYDSTYSGIQDEWLISPSMDLTNYENTELDFWWAGSYYWSVSPYDNCDLSVYVSTSGSSGPWTMVWTEPTATWTSWQYYNAIVDLSAYDGEGDVMLGFQYYGYDGAEFDVDDILVTADEGGGPGPGTGYGGAVGIMDQGATWNVDILNNEVYDVHSSGWAYGIEVTPTAVDPETAHFEAYLDFTEDFTGVSTGSLPAGWTKDPTTTNWGAYPSSYAGGTSPEMRFYYSPSSTDDFYCTTPEIDTSAFTTLDLSFSHYINHYTTPYTLKVVALAGGNEYLIDSWSPTGSGGPFYESYTLTAAEGVGASDFQLSWVFSGYSWNINYWYFDNVVLHGSYNYDQTVYPWPLDVNIDGNHLYRINLGEGYPCPDEPAYPGVMLTVNYATLPTGGPTPADASEVIAHNNWFDMDCFYPAIAILNMDLQHCLMAQDNYYSQPDGPGTYPVNETIYDCLTGEPADGLGSLIVNYGPVAFDHWLGLNAVHNQPDTIYATTGESIFFNSAASWANPDDGFSFFWKFDDGYYSMEPSIAHTYNSPGEYHGYLRVHNFGIPLFNIPPMYEWDYFTVIVTGAGAPLSANAGGGSLGHYEVAMGEEITLQGSASGGTPPYTYSWDLGDGRIVQGQNPTVFYNLEDREDPQSETYTVTLTVIDDNYDVATDTVTLTVLAPGELDISIDAPANAATDEQVTFHSVVAGGTAPYTYSWNFGDGITSTLATPVHIYENDGTYTVTLTVKGALGQEKTTTTTIEIVGESSGTDPQIKAVKGFFGVKATIAAGDNDCNWAISVDGKYVFSGGDASGTIPANMEQTVKLPLTIALGKVTVTVTAGSITQQYTALALGPLFLNLK